MVKPFSPSLFLYIIFPLLGHTRILFLFLTLVSMVKEYTLIEHRFKSILGFKHFQCILNDRYRMMYRNVK